MIQNNPENVRYSMIVQARENISPGSSERIDFLKQKFKDILENLVPKEIQSSLVYFDNMSIQKWLKIQKASKYKFSNNPSGNVMVDNWHKFKYSKKVVDYWEKYGKAYLGKINYVRKWARKLIFVRNKLIKAVSGFPKYNPDMIKEYTYPMEKEDHIVMTQAMQYFEAQG
mmetsp:Transcript_107/g.102  ORF Transcript_107/g.102 Transcript_107/m.102 type:complete len:170 (+) Transcript_107:347-856(+)